MKVLALITALGLAATAALASPTPPMLDVQDVTVGNDDNGTVAAGTCRRGHGCDNGRCWRSCNEDEGTWCWMAESKGAKRLSCSSDATCFDAIRHGTAACDLSICSDCGCKCW
ncbi:hypothetical protein PLIIFM63780_008171 [Purpureocillium lilacinum]|uniref:Uncharacterized protein n=1 Tax=Purpureocillium lilacinum TaxID=33203 RepID=A0ACC4DTU6_PURLI|nr:hypothetical protein PLIIFM63780_008171 [Purpureocillium lilacinum]